MGVTLKILETPLVNQFDDSRYSHEDYLQFSTFTQGSLSTNLAMSGLSAAQKTNFDQVFEVYRSLLSDERSTQANQKGSTAAIDEAWASIVAEVRRKEGLVKSQFDKNSPGYLRYFPQGLFPYNNARRGEQLALVDNLITQFTTDAALFPGVAATFTSLKTAYLSASNTQAESKGGVKSTKNQRDAARLDLANALHEAWLTIALRNMGKPEVIKIFFDPSIFDKGINYDNDGLGLLKVLVQGVDGLPIINARVGISRTDGTFMEKGITDDNGYYESASLPIGFYNVEASQEGYRLRISQFQVFDNRDPLREMFLERE